MADRNIGKEIAGRDAALRRLYQRKLKEISSREDAIAAAVAAERKRCAAMVRAEINTPAFYPDANHVWRNWLLGLADRLAAPPDAAPEAES